jgi:hypothetical protein
MSGASSAWTNVVFTIQRHDESVFFQGGIIVVSLLTGEGATVRQGDQVLLGIHHLDEVFCTSSLLQFTYDGRTGAYKVY